MKPPIFPSLGEIARTMGVVALGVGIFALACIISIWAVTW